MTPPPRPPRPAALFGLLAALAGPALAPANAEFSVTFKRLGSARWSGAEIVDFDRQTQLVLATGRPGVALLTLGRDGSLTPRQVVPIAQLAATAGLDAGATVTHVAADPAGRAFAACTLMPADRSRTPGKAAFFTLPDGAVRSAATVGIGPDAAKFAPDGSAFIVTNEAEPAVLPDGTVDDRVGGLSVIDLSAVRQPADLDHAGSAVATVDLDTPAITASLNADGRASGLRIAPRTADRPAADLEPESLAVADGQVFVTLQENNGLAVFDLATRRWSAITGLGVTRCTIDASDRDGLAGKPAIKIDKAVDGLPMPDQVAAFTVNGKTYLALAAEGDDRGNADDREPSPIADRARLKHLAAEGRLAPSLPADLLADSQLGRLKVCTDWGLDDQGRIERPTMQGTRSLLIVAAESLARVGDTGPQFEQAMAQYASEWFNANSDSSTIDRRSPDRGPEPEGVVTATIGGRTLAFVTLERPGALVAVDLADPAKPVLTGLHVSAGEDDTGPEGLCFIPADASPTGRPIVLVGFESSGTIVAYEVLTR